MLAAGVTASLCISSLWGSNVRRYQRQAFRTAATDVSATAQTLLRRDTDFLGTLDTVMTAQPHLAQAGLDQWYTELEGRRRQVGSLGLTVISAVAAGELRSFLARRDRDPSFRATFGRPVPVPRDGRERYCLLSTAESIVGTPARRLARELQGDWCQSSSAIGAGETPLIELATRSRSLVVHDAFADGVHTMLLEQAFYRRGAPLNTVAQRNAAVRGWLVSTFDVDRLLRGALGGRAGLAVYLYHANNGGPAALVGRTGSANAHGETYSTAAVAEGPWTFEVRGAVPLSGLAAGEQARIVLVMGTLITLLLTGLLTVLVRSGERAVGMARQKTHQLRHHQLHDALTGLPNRALALDRAEQMLARARGADGAAAALSLDIDGFKRFNETFGHAAGEEVLRIVADRLADVVRPSDTIARLVGDEFLVLTEGSTLDAGPELLAQRLLDVLRAPFELAGAGCRRLSVTISVGIALAAEGSAEQLLRDAQLARHGAKARGGNRCEICQSAMQSASRETQMLGMDLLDALIGRSCSCSTSRRSACAPRRSWASRRCSGGATRLTASSHPNGSCRWRRRAG